VVSAAIRELVFYYFLSDFSYILSDLLLFICVYPFLPAFTRIYLRLRPFACVYPLKLHHSGTQLLPRLPIPAHVSGTRSSPRARNSWLRR